MKLFRRTLSCFLSLAAAVTVMCGLFAVGASAEILTYPTQQEISERYYQLGLDNIPAVTYKTPFSKVSPYAVGELSASSQNDALKLYNFLRFTAGLPDNVQLDDTYSYYAQAACLVNAMNGTQSHYPPQPAGFPDDLYEIGRTGAGKSNLGRGYDNIVDSLISYMCDSDTSNIPMVGHRRWILYPGTQKVGFGYVTNFTATYVIDSTRTGSGSIDYVSWPPQNMPYELYLKRRGAYAFSVNLGAKYKTPSLDSVKVTVTSRSLGKTWELDSSCKDKTGLYLNVENNGYGMTKCIIFNTTLFPNNDHVTVHISGIQYSDGSSAEIDYSVDFFSLDAPSKPSIADCTVSPIPDQLYTGSAVTPAVTVKYDSKTLTAGTDYTVAYSDNVKPGTAKVTITGKGNYTGTYTAQFGIVKPEPVRSPAVTAIPGDAQVTLHWNAIDGASKYAAYIVQDDGTLKALATRLTDTTYTAAKLTNGTKYKFLVRAYANGCWSVYSDNEMTECTPVSSRPAVTAVPGDSEVTLTWNAIDGASKYAVYRVDPSGAAKCLNSRLTALTYTAKKLTNGTTYKFYVRAYVDGVWSKFGDADMAECTPVCLRPAVSAVPGDSEVTLTWNAIDGASKYAVYRVDPSGAAKCLNSRLTALTYTAKKLTNGTTYKFYVRAYVGSAWSKFDNADMTACTPVSTKPSVTAAPGNKQVTLSWSPVDGASKYAVYTVQSDGTLKCHTSRHTETSYTVNKLTNGTTYRFLVRAYVNGAWSKYTDNDIVSATPTAGIN